MKRCKIDVNKIVGNKYGCWLILSHVESKPAGKYQFIIHYFKARCNCGNEKVISYNNFYRGHRVGCRKCHPKVNVKMISKDKLYSTWRGIMYRCYNIKAKGYKYYGRRGIKVYSEWHNFEKFRDGINSIIGAKPNSDYSLDRINVNGDYEPQNVRWATHKTQANNKVLSNILTAKKLATITGYSRERIRQLTYCSRKNILKPYLERAIKCNKRTHYIYKDEAIEFLLERRKTV